MKMLSDFWSFVNEREQIRLRRLAGLPREQWTQDEILRTYSFTNVKREHDRTTQLLKREFYDVHGSISSTRDKIRLINCALFRFFGTIEMARAIGWTDHWDERRRLQIREIATDRYVRNETIFTGAYIVPAAGRSEPKYELVLEFIMSIARQADEIVQYHRWEIQCDLLCSCYGVGSFMAKEILLDFYLGDYRPKPQDWQTWTPVGPGARRGAARVRDGFLDKGLPEREALEVCRKIYESRIDPVAEYCSCDEGGSAGVTSSRKDCDIHGRDAKPNWSHEIELDLTDIQFQLCEFDKYQRAKNGEGKPKRKFWPTIDEITSRPDCHCPHQDPQEPDHDSDCPVRASKK